MPPCLIGMEACVGAHHLSRKLKALGHEPRLMPAKYVRPYSKGQKNDFRDAEAIAEAVQRPTMKFVPTKTAEQLDLQALHRVRERLVSQRTGVINQIRAFLQERDIAVRQGRQFLRAGLPTILATRSDVLSGRMQHVIEGLAEDWRRLDERIDKLSTEIEVLVHEDAGAAEDVSARANRADTAVTEADIHSTRMLVVLLRETRQLRLEVSVGPGAVQREHLPIIECGNLAHVLAGNAEFHLLTDEGEERLEFG